MGKRGCQGPLMRKGRTAGTVTSPSHRRVSPQEKNTQNVSPGTPRAPLAMLPQGTEPPLPHPSPH